MPCLVFEYMEHGDLAKILRYNTGLMSTTNEQNTPTISLVNHYIWPFRTTFLLGSSSPKMFTALLELSAVSNESIDFAVFRILQEEQKTTGA